MTAQQSSPVAPETEREMVLERTFDAPRELVFKAWTSAEHLGHWYGPRGFTITTHSFDFREGGTWSFIMHGPNDMNWDSWMFFTAIDEPSRILVVYGESPDINNPDNMQVSITFDEVDGKTRLRQRTLLPTVEQFEVAKGFGAVELGYQTLDKLAEYLTRI